MLSSFVGTWQKMKALKMIEFVLSRASVSALSNCVLPASYSDLSRSYR